MPSLSFLQYRRTPRRRGRSGRSGRIAVALLVTLSLGLAALPSQADLAGDIEKLKEEREQLQESREDKARQIDVSTAEANELAAALAVLNGQVNEQEGRLATAEAALEEAQARFAAASQAVVDKKAEIQSLKQQVSDRAISAFVDQNVGSTPVLENTDPNRAVRMQSLVQSVTQQEVDVAEQLREAKEDLAFEEARADKAARDAEELRATIESELVALQGARDEQARLTDEAENRLDAQLAEAAIMAERDQAIADEITAKNSELQKQLELARRRAAASASRNPAGGGATPGFPSADQIVKVEGYWIHVDIADNLQRMLDAARADGITFGGWGYRNHQTQIRLRREHCGTSQYAIWQMSSSRCRPPTARPGRSMHEQGKAIDFTYNGRTIGSRSSPGYKWLAAHAASYGFYNLPSEPWHWSVNGN